MQILTDAQHLMASRISLVSTLEQLMRTLAGNYSLDVSITYSDTPSKIGGHSAYVTYGETRFYASDAFGGPVRANVNLRLYGFSASVEDYVSAYGIAYHELGHVLLSARNDFLKLRTLVRNEHVAQLLHVLNILEDFYVERHVVSKWNATRAYLFVVIKRMIIERNDPARVYPLLANRLYVPSEIRAHYASVCYLNDTDRNRLYSVAEKYIDAAVRGSVSDMFAAVREYSSIIGDYGGNFDVQDALHKELCSAARDGIFSRLNGKYPSESAKADAENGAGVLLSEDIAEDTSLGQLGDDVDNAVYKVMTEAPDSDIDDLMNGIMNAIIGSGDTARTVDAASGPAGSISAPIRYDTRAPVDRDMVVAREGMADAFRELQDAAEPTYAPSGSGRFNLGRYLNGADLTEVYDRWDAGKANDTAFTIVVAVDVSASMDSHSDVLSKAVWSIYGISDVFHLSDIHVITFNVEHTYIEPESLRDDATYACISCNGGTNPLSALLEGAKMLEGTNKNKILIIMTDGEWDTVQLTPDGYDSIRVRSYAARSKANNSRTSRDESEGIIKACNEAGVLTVIVNVGDRGKRLSDHGCAVTSHIASVSDLPAVIRTVVKSSAEMEINSHA